MIRRTVPLLALAALTLGACATTGDRNAPTEVSRYDWGQPIPPGSVTVEPASGGNGGVLEFAPVTDAVAGELSRVGFAPVASGASSQYVALVSFGRTSRGVVRTPPKFSIGLGGGSFSGGRGGGVGLGGGVGTGIGSKTRDLLVSELFVQMRRRSDGTVVWEGRAQRPDLSGPDTGTALTAGRLANALFRGFPGESGITTTVP